MQWARNAQVYVDSGYRHLRASTVGARSAEKLSTRRAKGGLESAKPYGLASTSLRISLEHSTEGSRIHGPRPLFRCDEANHADAIEVAGVRISSQARMCKLGIITATIHILRMLGCASVHRMRIISGAASSPQSPPMVRAAWITGRPAANGNSRIDYILVLADKQTCRAVANSAGSAGR
jgi:hypothetical protein